jgi:hypothetical protein
VESVDDTVFLLGVDSNNVNWDLTLLGANVYPLQGRRTGHALLGLLSQCRGALVIAGPAIPDMSLAETVRRIRVNPETRHASIVAWSSLPVAELPGANVVLPPTTDTLTLERWIAKLRAVPPRAKLFVDVRGDTVDREPFQGVSRNISATGMRVVSDQAVEEGKDLELSLDLPRAAGASVLGRVVRQETGTGAVANRGYGIEFLYVPPATQEAISRIIAGHDLPARILRGKSWICELLHPTPRGPHWEVEVRRARGAELARERFITVAGATPADALDRARDVTRAWMRDSGPAEDVTPSSS